MGLDNEAFSGTHVQQRVVHSKKKREKIVKVGRLKMAPQVRLPSRQASIVAEENEVMAMVW